MTLTQLTKNPRIPKSTNTRRKDLRKCPQKRAVCLKVTHMTPRKPNSAIRKIARCAIVSHACKVTAYIPGMGHNLQKHASVLLRGGRTPDLPGLRYKMIRGVYDFQRLALRRRRRSKYGTKAHDVDKRRNLYRKVHLW